MIMITKERLQELINLNLYQHQIAEQLNCSQATISNLCKKHGIIIPRKPAKNRKDITNLRVGMLLVLEPCGINKYLKWKCRCDCGKIKDIHAKHLISGIINSCGCIRNRPAKNRKGYGDISGSFFREIQRSAQKRNISFNITPQQIWELFVKQDAICALSGLKITLIPNKKKKDKQTASLDRIDSSKGYDIDNVQWVHKDINLIKRQYKQEYFLLLVRNIYHYKCNDAT